MNSLTRVLADNPLYLAAYSNDRVAGFLPLRWKNGDLGPVINGLPFYGPNGGPIITCIATADTETITHAPSHASKALAADLGAASLAVYTPFLNDPSTDRKKAFKPDRIVEKFTQYIDITDKPLSGTRSRRAIMRKLKSKRVYGSCGNSLRIFTHRYLPRKLCGCRYCIKTR